MAGGLFGKPFAVNEKCIVFSIIVIALFLARPQLKSVWAKIGVPTVLFVIAYVGMAWYDYYYDCRSMPLQRGGGPTSMLKPPVHAPEKQEIGGEKKDSQEENRHRHLLIYAAHVAVIAPLLDYVAYKGRRAPKEVWTILGTVAVLTAGYHGAKLVQAL
jgi:hypothetical protein